MICYTNVVLDYHSHNHSVASNNDHKMWLTRTVWYHHRFLLSLTDPQGLHSQSVDNHHYALQFPGAVAKDIAKEKALGALLYPVNNIWCLYIDCSPLVTRPK